MSQRHKLRLLDQVTQGMRERGCSESTQRIYRRWIAQFIRYHQMIHPEDLGLPDIREFLQYLARERGLSEATRHQALNSLLFLYRRVLGRDTVRWHKILRDEFIETSIRDKNIAEIKVEVGLLRKLRSAVKL